jgi:hypothetical protein
VERIVSIYPEDPNTFHVEHFQYNGAQQMWLYRTYTCEAPDPNDPNDPNTPTNIVGLSAWEFRYAGGGRARYLVRERDANVPVNPSEQDPYLEPLENGRWYEYVGDHPLWQTLRLRAI